MMTCTAGARCDRVRGPMLVVLGLGAGGVCDVGSVDALATADADDLARVVADRHAQEFRSG